LVRPARRSRLSSAADESLSTRTDSFLSDVKPQAWAFAGFEHTGALVYSVEYQKLYVETEQALKAKGPLKKANKVKKRVDKKWLKVRRPFSRSLATASQAHLHTAPLNTCRCIRPTRALTLRPRRAARIEQRENR